MVCMRDIALLATMWHIFWPRIAYSLEMQMPSTGHLYAKKRLDDFYALQVGFLSVHSHA